MAACVNMWSAVVQDMVGYIQVKKDQNIYVTYFQTSTSWFELSIELNLMRTRSTKSRTFPLSSKSLHFLVGVLEKYSKEVTAERDRKYIKDIGFFVIIKFLSGLRRYGV